MKHTLLTLAVSFLFVAASRSEEATVTSVVEAKVKAATVIDGKGGIYEWLAKGKISGAGEWKCMGQVLMMPKTMFMVEMNMMYSKEGGAPSEILGPKLGSDLKFADVEADEGTTIQTFELNGNPAAVRVYDGNSYLYLTTQRLGKMEKEDALREMLFIIKSLELERSR